MHRILVIDDDATNLLVVRSALGKLGYPGAICEQDPRRAVERFATESFDLVLLDINMPGMSGIEVLAAISGKARRLFIPVIMVTAQSDRDTRLMLLNAGASDFLGKPIDMADLGVRIRNLLEMRGMHLALTQQRDELEVRVAERTRELHETQLEIIRRLATAAEFRDNDTGAHVQRMSRYARAVGKALGLSVRELDVLLNACPMHDVGKIGIRDEILLKPGKLTPEEFEEMKRHTTIGAEILAGHDSELLRTAREIAVSHHERWDGGGYPNGLAGAAIPFSARIAAIADVFDALTSVRPYKRPWSVDDAFAYINEQRGIQFDPDVCVAFMDIREEILSIKADVVDGVRQDGA